MIKRRAARSGLGRTGRKWAGREGFCWSLVVREGATTEVGEARRGRGGGGEGIAKSLLQCGVVGYALINAS